MTISCDLTCTDRVPQCCVAGMGLVVGRPEAGLVRQAAQPRSAAYLGSGTTAVLSPSSTGWLLEMSRSPPMVRRPSGRAASRTSARGSVMPVVSADSEPGPVLTDDLLKLGGILRQARHIPDQHQIREASCDASESQHSSSSRTCRSRFS